MYGVLSAFLFTHLFADFTLQTDWIAENKHDSRVAMGSHVAIHGVVALVALAVFMPLHFAGLFAVGYTVCHLLIDSIHPRPAINIDQSAHLAVSLMLWGSYVVIV